MITVNVKLFGTLPDRYAGYDKEKGMIISLEPEATVADLTRELKLASPDYGVVAMDGQVAKPEQKLKDNAHVQIFQRLHGG